MVKLQMLVCNYWQQSLYGSLLVKICHTYSNSPLPFTAILPQRYKNIAIQQKNHLFFIPMLYNSEILCNFAAESYAGGKYVLRKAFRNGSFRVGSDIFKKRLLALVLVIRKLETF